MTLKKTYLLLGLMLTLVLGSLLPNAWASDQTTNQVAGLAKVTSQDNELVVDIVSINDFHGSLIKSGKNVGIANLVNEVKAQKAANPNTIFVAAGDLFQGSAESNLLYGKPVAESLKEAGLVASAIGNHEYDWGNNRFATWEKEGGFQFLAANIYDRKTKKPVAYAKPYQIVKLSNGIKVAFIGG